MEIREPRILFETAKLAKQKGFLWAQYELINVDKLGEIEGVHKFNASVKLKAGVETDDGTYYCYNEDGKEITPKKFSYSNSHYPRPRHYVIREWLHQNFGYHILGRITDEDRYYHEVYVRKHPMPNPVTLIAQGTPMTTKEESEESVIIWCLTQLPDYKPIENK